MHSPKPCVVPWRHRPPAWGGRPVRKLELPRDVALVTILRGQRVIVPEPDQPLEGGDELLFVAAPDVEVDLRRLLTEGR